MLSYIFNNRSTLAALVFIPALLLFLFLIPTAFASSTTLAWDRPNDEAVTGYSIYYGLSGTNYKDSPKETINSADQTQIEIINLEPGQEYLFSARSLDGNGIESDFSAEISYQTQASYSITASVLPVETGSIQSSSGGFICRNSCSGEFEGGTSPVFTITPDNGYLISDVLVNGASVGPVSSYTFENITADQTISASFTQKQYTVTASVGAGGSITPSGNTVLSHGESISYTIAAGTGYAIADVTVNGTSAGAVSSYTFNSITADQTISASFAPKEYTVTAIAGTGGSITPSGNTVVSYGGSVSYTISAGTGYEIADVTVNGSSVGPVSGYTFDNITADQTISASFTQKQYTVTASAGGGGAITPNGDTVVSYGGSVSYTISAGTGYEIADVTVNGTSVGPVSGYAFDNITSDMTISAMFAVLVEEEKEPETLSELPPDKPVLLEPADSAELASGAAIVFETDVYSHPEGSAHIASHWQIRRMNETKAFYSVVSNVDLTIHKVEPGLEKGLKYAWRVGFQDMDSGLVAWSDERAFVVGEKILFDQIPSVTPGKSNNDYQMVSFVHWPADARSEAVFGPMLETDYSSGDYRIMTYDPTFGDKGGYREYGDFEVVPGRSYWVLARYGLDLTTSGIPVTTTSDIVVPLDYNPSSGDGWSMIAVPNDADYYWGDVEIVVHDENGDIHYGPMPIKQLSADNPYIDTRLWEGKTRLNTKDEVRNANNFILTPHGGYWVNARAENVSLSFPYDMQAIWE